MAASARLSLQPPRSCCDLNAETTVVFTCASNAPVQARWANAQRANPAPPNPPTVACNRLLGYCSLCLAPTHLWRRGTTGSQVRTSGALTSTSVGKRSKTEGRSVLPQLQAESHVAGKSL